MQGMPFALHAWLTSGRRSNWIRRCRDDQGQGLVEYGMILAFVAMACVGALTLFGERLAAWSVWSALNGI